MSSIWWWWMLLIEYWICTCFAFWHSAFVMTNLMACQRHCGQWWFIFCYERACSTKCNLMPKVLLLSKSKAKQSIQYSIFNIHHDQFYDMPKTLWTTMVYILLWKGLQHKMPFYAPSQALLLYKINHCCSQCLRHVIKLVMTNVEHRIATHVLNIRYSTFKRIKYNFF